MKTGSKIGPLEVRVEDENDPDGYFVLRGPLLKSDSRYEPSQLNKMLEQKLKRLVEIGILEKDVFLNPKTNETLGWLVNNTESKSKVAVFKVVCQPDLTTSALELGCSAPTLEVALESFFSLKKNCNCKLIIAPVCVLGEYHFRLLVIDLKNKLAPKLYFYDSKAYVPAIARKVYHSIKSVKPEINLIDYSKHIIEAFKKSYHYITNVARVFYPKISATQEYFGHQNAVNNIDCGPIVLHYLLCALNDVPLSAQLKIDLTKIREEHNEWLYQYIQAEKKMAPEVSKMALDEHVIDPHYFYYHNKTRQLFYLPDSLDVAELKKTAPAQKGEDDDSSSEDSFENGIVYRRF